MRAIVFDTGKKVSLFSINPFKPTKIAEWEKKTYFQSMRHWVVRKYIRLIAIKLLSIGLNGIYIKLICSKKYVVSWIEYHRIFQCTHLEEFIMKIPLSNILQIYETFITGFTLHLIIRKPVYSFSPSFAFWGLSLSDLSLHNFQGT